MVAQIDEQHAAMVADAVAPAGQPHGLCRCRCRAARRRYGSDSDASKSGRFGVRLRRLRAEGAAKSAWGVGFVKASRRLDRRGSQSAHSRSNMPKAKRLKKPPPATADMTTAEATVAALLAHGLDTIYALPGVHNDHLFDALSSAPATGSRVVHTRHEQGAAYMALGAALATGKPQAYAVVPGPGPAQFRRRAAHRLRHERAGAGADRANSRTPTSAAGSAICTRSATRPASSRGWSIMPRSSAAPATRRARSPRRCARWSAAGPARPRSNAPSMSGASAARSAPHRAARCRRARPRSTTTRCAPPPSCSARPRSR